MTTPTGGSDPNQGWSQGPPPADPAGAPPPPPQGYSTPEYGQQGYPQQGQPYGGAAPGGGALAGFWIRFGAAFIDGILIGIVTWLLRNFLGEVVGGLIGLLIGAAYFVYFHSSTGQSLGQKMLNIKVVDETGGGTIDPGRAGIRWVVASFGAIAQLFLPPMIALIVLLAQLLGYLWMLWDAKNQTWHDKAAKTLVVKV